MKEPTSGPLFACIYPGLCDISRKLGYALALHGTLVRDMDLIAVPWVEDAATPDQLYVALKSHLGALSWMDLIKEQLPKEVADKVILSAVERGEAGWEIKPHGRIARNLHLLYGVKVDLSVIVLKGGTI